MSDIVYNAIRTPDGTVLESRHVHDCVMYKDKNGTAYMVDGGHEYLRRSGEEYEELSLTLKDPHEKLRKALKWGTYGKDGKIPFAFIAIADMETDHLEAILRQARQGQLRPNPGLLYVMRTELKQRKNIATE